MWLLAASILEYQIWSRTFFVDRILRYDSSRIAGTLSIWGFADLFEGRSWCWPIQATAWRSFWLFIPTKMHSGISEAVISALNWQDIILFRVRSGKKLIRSTFVAKWLYIQAMPCVKHNQTRFLKDNNKLMWESQGSGGSRLPVTKPWRTVTNWQLKSKNPYLSDFGVTDRDSPPKPTFQRGEAGCSIQAPQSISGVLNC